MVTPKRRFVLHFAAPLFVLTTLACVTTPANLPPRNLTITGEDLAAIRVKLRRVGLDLLTADQARLPDDERGRYVAVRTLPEFESPALPHHPSGYLFVAIDDRPVEDSSEVFALLRDWEVDRPVTLTARLNPNLAIDVEWWEVHVKLALPR
ncbi:MAG: hypothetical protein KDC38_05955 [Planctomycetes bacterium]|nr:hypothetical protein [Planctomycetota bacterium]